MSPGYVSCSVSVMWRHALQSVDATCLHQHLNTLAVPWQAFDTVLNRAFFAMLIIYAIVAGLGYYYFGDAASVLITDDLAINSPFTGRSVRSMHTPSAAWLLVGFF